MPLPKPPESYMADALAGDQEPPVNNPWRNVPKDPKDVAFQQEYNRVYPLMKTKVNNFLGAIAGPPPDANAEYWTHQLLQDVFGVNFNDATREYVKYKQSNPVRRALTNVAAQAVVSARGDSYINDVLNNRIPLTQKDIEWGIANMPEDKALLAYQQKVVSRLSELLRDKNTAHMVMKHLGDFRQLEQPIPFIQSNINYKLPEPPAEQ